MGLLNDAIEEKKFDTRLIEKNVARGAINLKDVHKFEEELPDDASQAEWVSLEDLAKDDGGSSSDFDSRSDSTSLSSSSIGGGPVSSDSTDPTGSSSSF